jgi:hypothetical protein
VDHFDLLPFIEMADRGCESEDRINCGWGVSLRGFESKYWAWWYIAIGIGFLLLAIVNTMRGASLAGVAIRVVIAIGFEILGWIQYRTGR